jgi:hypothetical protein
VPQNGLLREIPQKVQKFASQRSLASGDVGRIGPALTFNCGHPPATWNAINSVHEVKVGPFDGENRAHFHFCADSKIGAVSHPASGRRADVLVARSQLP